MNVIRMNPGGAGKKPIWRRRRKLTKPTDPGQPGRKRDTPGGAVRVTFSLPEGLNEALRKFASETNRSLSDIARDAICKWMLLRQESCPWLNVDDLKVWAHGIPTDGFEGIGKPVAIAGPPDPNSKNRIIEVSFPTRFARALTIFCRNTARPRGPLIRRAVKEYLIRNRKEDPTLRPEDLRMKPPNARARNPDKTEQEN